MSWVHFENLCSLAHFRNSYPFRVRLRVRVGARVRIRNKVSIASYSGPSHFWVEWEGLGYEAKVSTAQFID